MSDTSKCHQHNVAYMKMSSKWCRIHGSSRPRKPPVAEMHIFATFFEVQLGGHGADKRGKDWTAERWGWTTWPKQGQIGPLRRRKNIFFFKHALGRSSKLCFLCRRGAHFQKNRETKLPESEKWSQKTLDGKYDGYMRGLDGAEKRKCWKTTGFTAICWGSRLEVRPRRRSRRPWLGGLGSSKKCDFWLKMLYAAISNCASCAGGEHIFRKIIKKCCPNVKNAVKIMSDMSKCHQHSVAYMKMSSKWYRIHGSNCPRKPPVAIIHIFARFFEVQLGGHGADKRGKERTTER